MNHYIIQYLTMVFLVCVMLLIRKFMKFKSKKKRIIFCILITIIIYMIPLESFFTKNKTPKQLVRFYYPLAEIQKEYTAEDYVYIFFIEKNNSYLEACRKVNKNWRLDKKSKVKIKSFKDKYIVYTRKLSSENSTGIMISYTEKDGINISITDNLKTNFDTFETKFKMNDYNYLSIQKIAVIDQDLDSDYILYLNGEEYRPFK